MASPYSQLIPVLITYVAYIVLLIRYQSFSSKLYFFTLVINEIVYALVLVCYFIFNIAKDSMSMESRRIYFG